MRLLDIFRQRFLVHREAVVHRGDLDLTGGEILHRMVRAVVALMHLHRPAADGDAEHLVTEADAEGRRARVDQLLDHRYRVFAGCRRVTGAVREENAVGFQRHYVLGQRLGWNDRHLTASAREQAKNVALDAVVDRDDVEFRIRLPRISLVPGPWRLVPGEALAARYHRHEVHADEARPFLRFFLQRREIELARRLVRNDGVWHSVDADQRGQRARVDAGEPNDAARLQPVTEMPRRAIVRRRRDGGTQDDTAYAGRCRHVDGFDVFFV